MQERYLEFLRYAIDNKKAVPESVKDIDWHGLFEFSKKQAIIGVVFDAIQRLNIKWDGQDRGLMMKWFAASENIRIKNEKVNRQCVKLTERLMAEGFPCCILKGQGNAMMYPNPMSRTSGDIDAWLYGTREDIYNYVRRIVPKSFTQDKHIEFPVFKDTVVEIHYAPTSFSNLFYQKRLNRYIQSIRDRQFEHKIELMGNETISIPTDDFNRIFQLCHIKSHFFVEGIGLRQLIDYYYLLKKSCGNEDEVYWLKHLGLYKFATGVMWIEKHILGLEDKYLLVQPDENIGKVIYEDVMIAGNFGHHDDRYKDKRSNLLMRGAIDSWRLLTMIKTFPGDVLWKLIQKVYNQRWKIFRK